MTAAARVRRWTMIVAGAIALVPGASSARDDRLPPIVFASRRPTALPRGQVPGLGPRGLLASAGGRLRLRAPAGDVRDVLAPGAMFDAAHPAISDDGRRIAFAGRRTSKSEWAIYVVALDGGGLRAVTRPAPRHADAAPCWVGDWIVFARFERGARPLYDADSTGGVWNLAAVRDSGGDVTALTFDPNGAIDPSRDPRTGRLLFARWWFNPFVVDAHGAFDGAVTGDAQRRLAGQWQALDAEPVLDAEGRLSLADVHLAAGGVPERREGMALQPVRARDGRVLATATSNAWVVPAPGPAVLRRYDPPPHEGARLAGALLARHAGDGYGEGRNLAAPSACAPAPLPDGRVIASIAPGGRGGFGLWWIGRDGEPNALFDDPGTDELDAAPVLAHPPVALRALASLPGVAAADPHTFAYEDRDVFAGPGAAPRTSGAKLRVYALVAAHDPAAPEPPDARLLREVAVARTGAVSIPDLPARQPLFEVLVDSLGRPLVTAHGTAQVRGFNYSAPGRAARCIGCHLGHSAAR